MLALCQTSFLNLGLTLETSFLANKWFCFRDLKYHSGVRSWYHGSSRKKYETGGITAQISSQLNRQKRDKKKQKSVNNQILFFESTSDIYKIIWVKFLEELYNQFQRLQTKIVPRGLRKVCRKWVHIDLVALHRLDTDLTRAVDFWVESTLDGYIVEFVVKCWFQLFAQIRSLKRRDSNQTFEGSGHSLFACTIRLTSDTKTSRKG